MAEMGSVFGGWIVRKLYDAAGSLVAKVLSVLGVHLAVQEFALPSMMAQVQSYFSGVPGDLAAHIGALRVDDGISLILSALAVRSAVRVVLRKGPL